MSEFKTLSSCKTNLRNAFVSFAVLSLIFSGISLSGCATEAKTPIDMYMSETSETMITTEGTSEPTVETTETSIKATEFIHMTESTETAETAVTTSTFEVEKGFTFIPEKDIELFENSEPYSGNVVVNGYDTSSFSASVVVFVSENTDVATIKNNGVAFQTCVNFLVTPVSAGETYIYAKTADGKVTSNRIKVTVSEFIEVDSIWIEESLSLDKGESHLILQEITPENPTLSKITWTSSDTSVVTVNDHGYVKAIDYGEAEVTATTTNGLTATCEITVALTEKEMTLKYSHPVNIGDSIGQELSFAAYIDDEWAQNKATYTFEAGETLEFYCWAEEDDSVPDEGDNTVYYTVTEDDLINGFTVEVDVYVTENRGPNAGNTAHFVFTFKFSPT